MTDEEISKFLKQNYINSEFLIKIYKSKGEETTTQVYIGSKQCLATGITSMVMQLIKNEIFSPNEMLEIMETAVDNLKK